MRYCALILSTLILAGCRASSTPSDPSDIRLRGRGVGGRGFAAFWNHTDDTTRYAIIVGVCCVVVVGIVLLFRSFFKEVRSLRNPRVRQPWET